LAQKVCWWRRLPISNTLHLFNVEVPMQVLSLGVFLCIALRSQAKFIGADGEEHAEHHNPQSLERSRLEHFLGLRHHPGSAVVFQTPAVPHGLHMLNHRVSHRVGPLLSGKALPPFGMHMRNMTLNPTDIGALASPIAAHAIAHSMSSKGWDAIKTMRGKKCLSMGKKHDMDFEQNVGKCVAFMEKECKVERIPICDEWFALLNKARAGGAPSPAGPSPDGGTDEQATTGANDGAKLPAQGYSGKLVAHENMVTQTADWHTEYGPGHHQSYCDVCLHHPENTWCKFRCAKEPVPTPQPESDYTSDFWLAVVLIIMALYACSRSLASGW